MSHDLRYWIPRATEDAHTPLAARDPRTRKPGLVYETDAELETFCPMFTARWGPDGELDHDQGCLMRTARRRR